MTDNLDKPPLYTETQQVFIDFYAKVNERAALNREFSLPNLFVDLAYLADYSKTNPELFSKSLDSVSSQFDLNRDELANTAATLGELSEVLTGLTLYENTIIGEPGEIPHSRQEFNQWLARLYTDALSPDASGETILASQIMSLLLTTPALHKDGFSFKEPEVNYLNNLDTGAKAHALLFGILQNQDQVAAISNPPMSGESGEEHELYYWEQSGVDFALVYNGVIILVDAKARNKSSYGGSLETNQIVSIEQRVKPDKELLSKVCDTIGVSTPSEACHVTITIPSSHISLDNYGRATIPPEYVNDIINQLKNLTNVRKRRSSQG